MICRFVLGCAVALVVPCQQPPPTAPPLMLSWHSTPKLMVCQKHWSTGSSSGRAATTPRASSRGNLGLMQIRYDTARGMGYRGPASGLLDANTNLTYAVPYLANAYRVGGGSHDRAVSLTRAATTMC
jgi:hypothetical protein